MTRLSVSPHHVLTDVYKSIEYNSTKLIYVELYSPRISASVIQSMQIKIIGGIKAFIPDHDFVYNMLHEWEVNFLTPPTIYIYIYI